MSRAVMFFRSFQKLWFIASATASCAASASLAAANAVLGGWSGMSSHLGNGMSNPLLQGLNSGGFGNGLGAAGLNAFGNGLSGNAFGSAHLNGFENGNTAGLWYGYNNQASQNPEFYQNGTAIPFSAQNSVSNIVPSLVPGATQNTVPVQSINSVETKGGQILPTIPVTISTQQNISAPGSSNITGMFENFDGIERKFILNDNLF